MRTTESRSVMRRRRANMPAVRALGVLGLVVAAVALRRSQTRAPENDADNRQAAWTTYLRDHLGGADTAIHVVDQLKHTHQGTPEGALFSSLHEQLLADREVVTELLTRLGASQLSIKRFAGNAAGSVLRAVAGGERGELSLFRTLEALAIGVQGKRCLWRAAQRLEPDLRAPGRGSFAELEADAVRQWETIEQLRLGLVPRTFAV